MNKKYIFSLLLLQLSIFAHANTMESNNMPTDLRYGGKPIDSLCFFDMENNASTIDLKNCGLEKEKYILKGKNDELIKKGFIGYNWKDPSSSSQGQSYYQFFDAGNHQFWVYTLNDSGGSGQFTAVYLVKRQGKDTLSLKAVAGGDRCNGGVQDVSLNQQTLTYSVNLTAYDFIALANKKLPAVKAYDDLAACAACCIAKAFYEVDASLKSKLSYVDLSKTPGANEMPDQGTMQVCFNKIWTSYVSKNELKLTQEKINDFVNQFSSTCVNATNKNPST